MNHSNPALVHCAMNSIASLLAVSYFETVDKDDFVQCALEFARLETHGGAGDAMVRLGSLYIGLGFMKQA